MRKLFPIKTVIRSSAGFKVEGLSGSDCRVRPEESGKRVEEVLWGIGD